MLVGIFPLAESKNTTNGNSITVGCKMDHDGNDDQEFDDVVIEGDCNTEEDDEEDKCIHSENESSVEAEDIGKDLESGMDFSFEDEEADYIEGTELNGKASLEDGFIDLSEEGCSIKMKSNIHDSSNIGSNQDPSYSINVAVKEEVQINCTNKISSGSYNIHFQEKASTITENQLRDCSVDVKEENDCVNEAKSSVFAIVGDKNVENNSLFKDSSLSLANYKVEFPESRNEVESNSVTVNKCDAGITSLIQDSINSGKKTDRSCDLDSLCKDWTREEDEIILQAIQTESGLDQAFETAKLQLPDRSTGEVRKMHH